METKEISVNSKEERLVRLAFTDDLTGLYNRRYFYRILPEEIEKTAALEKELSLLMIDIDEFKQFNDKYGHLTGDNVLSSVAEVLKKSTREEDIVARYAGDEFVVILPEASSEAAFSVASRILEATASYPFKGETEEASLRVTLSIGLATYPHNGTEIKELIGQADRALYSSKHAGRNRVCKTSDVLEEVIDQSKILSVFPCPKLIDREEEMLELSMRLKEAQEGKPNLVFIEGGAGIGKTRLLTEFRTFAQSKGAISLTIICYEEKIQMPYQSLILALGRYIEHIDSSLAISILQALPGPQLAVLEEVIPAAQELPLKIPEVRRLNEVEKRFELFKAFYQLLLNISKDNSLLLLTDDAHFVDKATLGLLKYIGRLKKANILACCAYRKENLINQKGERAPLSELIEEFENKKTFLKLELEPLTLKETLDMIETIFPGLPSSADLGQLVHKTTTGCPLFTEETLRSLVEDNLIYFQKGQWHLKEIRPEHIPASLEETVHKRFKRLDEEAKEILKKAAVAGEEFDLDLLSQVGKKAPAQLLEVIDRTANSQLIQEKEALNADEFSFINDRIRELLYELISLEERQETHHEIGEIEEKRHKLDLDKVAAKIAYHFSHTEDLKKAADFALKAALKAKELFVYEESLNYPQEVKKPQPKALESEEPLSNESHKEVVESIKFLIASISNIKMYPKGSAMTTNSLQNAYNRLIKAFDESEVLTISETKGKLLINGVEVEGLIRDIDATKKFVAFLSEHSLKSFSLLDGLSVEELSSFLEALGMKREELKEKGGFESFLEDKEVKNIVVNVLVYVVAGEKTESKEEQLLEAQAETKPLAKEKTRESARLREGTPHSEAVNILEQAMGQMGNLMEALSKIREITSSLPGEKERQEIERLVTHKISSLDTSSLSSFLTQKTTSPKVEEELHLKNKVIKGLPLSKISSLIEKMAPEYNNLSGKEKEDMGHLLNRFLNRARGPNYTPLVYQKFFQTKTLRNVLENISSEWEEKGKPRTRKSFLLDKADQLSKKSPIDLLSEEIKDELPSMMVELASLDEENLAVEILKKLVENLDNDTPAIRSDTSLLIKRIDEGLEEVEKEKLVEVILDNLIKSLEKEEGREAFFELAGMLINKAKRQLEREEWTISSKIIKIIGRIALTKDETKAEISDFSKQILEKNISNNFLGVLKEKIKSGEKVEEATNILAGLGERSIPALIEAIKETESLKTREKILGSLKEIGDLAVQKMVDELDRDISPLAIKRIAEVIDKVEGDRIPHTLGGLLLHPDIGVKGQIIKAIYKRGENQLIGLLIGILREKDSVLRQMVIDCLGKMRAKEAVGELISLLKKEKNPNIQRSICTALGNMKDESAVPALSKMLKPVSFLGIRMKRKTDHQLDLAVVWALGEIGGREAKQALQKISMDDNRPALKAMAETSLKGLD